MLLTVPIPISATLKLGMGRGCTEGVKEGEGGKCHRLEREKWGS